MRFIDYCKDKIISIIIVLFEISLIFLILYIFKVSLFLNIIIISLNLSAGIILLIYNFVRKKTFYDTLQHNLNKLDKKYYVLETIPEPTTYEEKIMVDSLYEINKSMIENIKAEEEGLNSFKEFVEIWIHEVKIPISSLVLKCHNNNYSEDVLSVVRKLDNYVDQVLYYVRSEETEKDFVINEVNLKDIVKNVTLKNKDDLLENNIDIEIKVNSIKVDTDSKWLEFIINQIINNSIKYKKNKASIIKIETTEENNKVILSIYDNGIGIPKKDLQSIFNKSFTGSNGRSKTKSTGMGLYIVKNLIDKLGHKIEVDSSENEYTKVSIIFSKNHFYKI